MSTSLLSCRKEYDKEKVKVIKIWIEPPKIENNSTQMKNRELPEAFDQRHAAGWFSIV